MNKLDENIIATVEQGNTMTATARILGLKFARVQRVFGRDKYDARKATSKAIRNGILVRPDHCSDCKTPCKPDAHHADYSQPLVVEWLCGACHWKRHSKPKPEPEPIEEGKEMTASEAAAELGRAGGMKRSARKSAASAISLAKARAARRPKENVTNSLTFGYEKLI